jgi:hypothetical protein
MKVIYQEFFEQSKENIACIKGMVVNKYKNTADT